MKVSAPDPGAGADRHPRHPAEEAALWLVWHSGSGEPAFNMALDEALLEAAPRIARPVLRFYGWAVPAATFGYFQRYAEVERLTTLRPLIRRPTGGGVVPHAGDWTYSLVFPPGHPWYDLRARASYERLHRWLEAAFRELGLDTALAAPGAAGPPTHCFQRAEAFDVVLAQSGLTCRVPADQSILDSLIAQGCDPLFDCKRGECGVCTATVIEGEPDHRDYFLSDAEKAGGKLIQICISRAKSARLVLDL